MLYSFKEGIHGGDDLDLELFSFSNTVDVAVTYSMSFLNYSYISGLFNFIFFKSEVANFYSKCFEDTFVSLCLFFQFSGMWTFQSRKSYILIRHVMLLSILTLLILFSRLTETLLAHVCMELLVSGICVYHNWNTTLTLRHIPEHNTTFVNRGKTPEYFWQAHLVLSCQYTPTTDTFLYYRFNVVFFVIKLILIIHIQIVVYRTVIKTIHHVEGKWLFSDSENKVQPWIAQKHLSISSIDSSTWYCCYRNLTNYETAT